ncbi:MAG: recombinase family protein [Gemmatimonadota bacterium]
MNRPEIQRLLADVASGPIDVVLVYKLDRPAIWPSSATTSTSSTRASARSFWKPSSRRSRSKGRREPA